jgi:uncharacterized protein (DUF433 family)
MVTIKVFEQSNFTWTGWTLTDFFRSLEGLSTGKPMSPTEVLRTPKSWITKTPGSCGGRACIRDTRIPVWSVVVARRLGTSDQDLLNYFVTPLHAGDVEAAMTYVQQHSEEIEKDIMENDNA